MSCVFCERRDRGEYSKAPGERVVMRFEPLNPVTPGHMLFMPFAHVDNAAAMPRVTGDVFEAAARWADEQGEPFNLITSAGTAATQTIHHLHVHYVPRRLNDDLHLPWTGQRD